MMRATRYYQHDAVASTMVVGLLLHASIIFEQLSDQRCCCRRRPVKRAAKLRPEARCKTTSSTALLLTVWCCQYSRCKCDAAALSTTIAKE